MKICESEMGGGSWISN